MSSGDKMGKRYHAVGERTKLRNPGRGRTDHRAVRTIVRSLNRSALLFVGVFGCGSELPPLPGESSVELEIEPSDGSDAVPPVMRLRVSGRAAHPATLRLFRDELSDYHVGRLRAGEPPATLLEREVPTLAWSDDEGSSVRPLGLLEDGPFTLASPELGAIGTFQVSSASAIPLYRRLWPPVGVAGDAAVYCGAPAELSEVDIVLEPQGPPAKLIPGLGSERVLADRCLSIDLAAELPEGLWLVPPTAGQVLLDPEPLFVAADEPATSSLCAEIESALGAGCARVLDDSLELRADDPLLWIFVEPTPAAVTTRASERARVRGLSPDSEFRVRGETIDARGDRKGFDLVLRTAPARPRVVLNEILANANGAEPSMEWIELANAGSASANLEGYRLVDSGGSVTLPAHELPSGAFALLVKEGFVPDPGSDVPPLEGTPVLYLPSLGKSGLSNSGELLRLYDANDELVSQVPALKAPAAGVSVARSAPDAPDEESSFGQHAPPGASPGGPNSISDGEK
jgi:hypothetical protein